jgi:hypothetical protein
MSEHQLRSLPSGAAETSAELAEIAASWRSLQEAICIDVLAMVRASKE